MIGASPVWVVLVCALLYGCACFLTVQLAEHLCASIEPFDDGPRPGTPPTAWLIAGGAVLGGVVGMRTAQPGAVVEFGLLIAALAGAWYADVRCGIVPDYFTLVPLGLVFAFAIWSHNWGQLISAAIVFVPFAAAALVSKGRGMGWGDVKLTALGAAVLGLSLAVFALSGACIAAVIVAWVRKRRSEPIAFAPYIAGSIGVMLAIAR